MTDLSQSDIAELTRYGPDDVLGEFRHTAYDRVVDEWTAQRSSDLDRLEQADAFAWADARFEVVDGLDGPKFEIVTGVSGDGDLRDLARRFVGDWLDDYVESIQDAQAESLFSRQELRTRWLLDTLSKKDLKQRFDVAFPTIRGYEERAEENLDRAAATLDLVDDR